MKRLVERCDLILVVGSPTSSNSNRLREIAEKAGIPGYLIDGPEDLQREWFEGKQTVGVTAGASAPEVLVERVVARIREWGGAAPVDVLGQPENVVFSLPRELRIPVPIGVGLKPRPTAALLESHTTRCRRPAPTSSRRSRTSAGS